MSSSSSSQLLGFQLLECNKIYALTKVIKCGSKYVVTFDNNNKLKICMPECFTRSYEDPSREEELNFLFFEPKYGSFAGSEAKNVIRVGTDYKKYKFVSPKLNGCICHIARKYFTESRANISRSSLTTSNTTINYIPVVSEDYNYCQDKGVGCLSHKQYCPCIDGGLGKFINDVDVLKMKVKSA